MFHPAVDDGSVHRLCPLAPHSTVSGAYRREMVYDRRPPSHGDIVRQTSFACMERLATFHWLRRFLSTSVRCETGRLDDCVRYAHR